MPALQPARAEGAAECNSGEETGWRAAGVPIGKSALPMSPATTLQAHPRPACPSNETPLTLPDQLDAPTTVFPAAPA